MSAAIATAATVATGLLPTLLASPASGAEFHWNAASGDWTGTTNWSPDGLPASGDRVFVDFTTSGNSGIANVSTDNLPSPLFVRILNANRVQLKTFGSLGVSGDLIVGADRSPERSASSISTRN
jgi:hypothetical protein